VKTIDFKLHPYWQNHTGHCQVTYVSRNDKGQKIVHCLQDNGKNFGGIRLMRCTQDGEPSHPVYFTEHRAMFEKPPGDSDLEIQVRSWIQNYEENLNA
jgi:hypothetical protein